MAPFEEVIMNVVTEFFTDQINAGDEESLCFSLFYAIETRLNDSHTIQIERLAYQKGEQVSLPDGYTFSRMLSQNIPLFLDESAK